MKTVINLAVASLCLSLSGVVYAEPAGVQPTKSVASATDTAKPKAAKHSSAAAKPAVPGTAAPKDVKHTGSTPSPVSKPMPSAQAPKALK